MTRKHFVALAIALAETRPPVEADAARMQWSSTRQALVRAIEAFNPRFERDRFYRATEQEVDDR